MKRLLATIVLLVTGMIAPWWFAGLLGIVFVLTFEKYWEFILIFAIFDLVYGASASNIFPGFYLLSSAIIYFILNWLKQFLR